MSLDQWINKVVCGKNPEALEPLPSESVNCIMFSPPYWQQRDYKVKLQIGLEKTIEEYLEKMWLVFDELWRVLRKDGTMWVNLGDKYGGSGDKHTRGKEIVESPSNVSFTKGLEKSLLMIPEDLIKGLRDPEFRAFIEWRAMGRPEGKLEHMINTTDKKPKTLRNKCIWQKPNPMPCSAKDRFTTTWEYLYFLTKSKKYWFDLDAVRRPPQTGYDRIDKIKPGQSYSGYLMQYKANQRQTEIRNNPAGKNPGDCFFSDDGDFWTISTEPSKLAHYASYPKALCRTPLKAGCPKWICKECGMARVRITQTEYRKNPKGGYVYAQTEKDSPISGGGKKQSKLAEYHTLGWSFCSCLCPACGEADCKCGAKWRPGVLLDPFCGIGTTLIVAVQEGFDYCGIDIKQEYVDMSIKRLKDVYRQEELPMTG